MNMATRTTENAMAQVCMRRCGLSGVCVWACCTPARCACRCSAPFVVLWLCTYLITTCVQLKTITTS